MKKVLISLALMAGIAFAPAQAAELSHTQSWGSSQSVSNLDTKVTGNVNELTVKYANGTPVDKGSFVGQQAKANGTMKMVADAIRNDPSLPNALRDKIEECMHIVESVDPKDLGNITTVNFDAILDVIGDKYPTFPRA